MYFLVLFQADEAKPESHTVDIQSLKSEESHIQTEEGGETQTVLNPVSNIHSNINNVSVIITDWSYYNRLIHY